MAKLIHYTDPADGKNKSGIIHSDDISNSRYVHNQTTASDTWIIQHDLNRIVSVSIYNTDNAEIQSEILVIDKNKVIVKFTAPFAGTAVII